MTQEQTARAWTGIFKRSAGPSSAAVAAPPPATDHPITSKVFPRFLTVLAQREAPAILDLGPVVGPNIAFFGERLACKIYVEDVFADIEDHASRGLQAALPAFLGSRIQQPAESVDGVLCWDAFDFLAPAAGAVLAANLVKILRPGGVLYGCFGTTPVTLKQYTRTVVESESILRPRRYPATSVTRTVRLTRDIIKMFGGLEVVESVLLKSNTRETLFRKPA